MGEEELSQEESFQVGQPIVQPREAEGRRILAVIRSLGDEVSFSISQVPPVDPVLPQHLSLFIQSLAPGGSRPQRVPTPQRVEPTPQRFLPTSSNH